MHTLISASSGVGKTAVTNELASRGFAAYDMDTVPGLARLELRETGEAVTWPEGYIDWKKYGWNLQSSVLDSILSSNESVFLSGICGNQDEFYHRFGTLIVLTIDPDEHERRMRSRPYRGSNDDEINIQHRITNYPKMLQRFLDAGFIPVDNSGTPSETADEILRITDAV